MEGRRVTADRSRAQRQTNAQEMTEYTIPRCNACKRSAADFYVMHCSLQVAQCVDCVWITTSNRFVDDNTKQVKWQSPHSLRDKAGDWGEYLYGSCISGLMLTYGTYVSGDRNI